MNDQGKCDYCGAVFVYGIFHDGQGESVYAYCDQCGELAVLNRWTLLGKLPSHVVQPTSADIEAQLQPCECGGAFVTNAGPRCPKCKVPISDERMVQWLRQNVPGLACHVLKDRQNWCEKYAFSINKSFVRDNFK
jgi:hypothetical protein